MTRGVWFGIALVVAASTAQAQDMMRGDDRMGGRGMSGVGMGAGIAAGVITGILASQPKQGASAQPASSKPRQSKKAAKKPVPQDQPQQGGGTPPVADKPPADTPPPAGPGGDIVRQDTPSVPPDGTPPTPPSTTTDGGGTTPKPEDPTDLPKKTVTIATKPGEQSCCSCAKSLTLKLKARGIGLPPGIVKGDPNADDETAQADKQLPARTVNGHIFSVEIGFETKKSDTPGPLTFEWEETMDRPNSFYKLVGIQPDVPANLVTVFGDSTAHPPDHPNSTVRDLVRHEGEFKGRMGDTTLTRWFTSYLAEKAIACPVKSDMLHLEDTPWAISPRRLFFRIKVKNPPNCGCPPTGKASLPPAVPSDTQSLELKAAQILWPISPGNTKPYPPAKREAVSTFDADISKFYGPGGEMSVGQVINGVPAPAPPAAVPAQPPPALRKERPVAGR